MATPLTEADIDAFMARAVEAAVRRHPTAPPPAELPNDLASTLASLTVDGWCQVGSLAAGAGDASYHVEVNIHTGAGRLRRWT